MPAEPTTLGHEACKEFVGREIAIGFPLILELSRLGIKKIAVATDMNHHKHPMSAVVDWFGSTVYGKWRYCHHPAFSQFVRTAQKIG